ncbi:hypothetical protein AArcSl_0609 [Halalkaliarchaeum desulfuricum]|uniref:Uncharacterized protein n=1 Tax=Halalkaliarchaeum desulfuricum TaxID=2055893 RepID=A0A343TGN7_9EURY|nr:hypothetical protein [Halalkaliarchaeum desulfuricum]AUX08259.1 hypothetical protein AArcSl_0609 [Halalkaliarchaeum desulfuricum]
MTDSKIRSRDDVLGTDLEVRRYGNSALYAYREGDDHVIVFKGNESWTKRIPARRNATVPNERLWTVPENWVPKLEIKGDGDRDYTVYRIPENKVDVLISVPVTVDADEAWYGVESVGKLRFSLDETLDQYEFSAALSDIEAQSNHDEDVLEALRRIERKWLIFKREYESRVDDCSPDVFWDAVESNGTPRIDGRSVDPWEDSFDVAHLLEEILDIDENVSRTVKEILEDVDAIPVTPSIEVTVEEDDSFADYFDFQGLIEAGCSPAEAVDYAMVVLTERTPEEWAATRNVDLNTVGENIQKARQQLHR